MRMLTAAPDLTGPHTDADAASAPSRQRLTETALNVLFLGLAISLGVLLFNGDLDWLQWWPAAAIVLLAMTHTGSLIFAFIASRVRRAWERSSARVREEV